MLSKVLNFFSGRQYRKFISNCKPIVAKINELEQSYQSLSDEQLREKTTEFMNRVQNGESLDHILPEAFATVKNAARRLCGTTGTVCDHELQWDMIHYDVQLIGGMALHKMKIAEMATGEGKTLVATLPLYLNALSGKNCQLATVNDYLARRDSEWMGHLYKFLGLTIGCIQNGMSPSQRREAYNANITYGTSSEFGFDYLRDNGMASSTEEQVQRDHFFCIVDEVDSILIDEARTPLIISGPVEQDREAPFMELRPGVQRLTSLQNKLCNQFASEAAELFKKGEEHFDQAGEKMLMVKLGSPKNKQLLKLIEDGSIRKFFEKFETDMHADYNRQRLFDLKEELYYIIDEKQHQADLSEKGRNTLRPNNPDGFVLPDLPAIFSQLDKNSALTPQQVQEQKAQAEAQFAQVSEEIHCLSQLLRAYSLYEKDVQYVVQEGKVVIVDENTGRAMPGRRWSEGLHQAVEAKENVNIERESKTFATITIQNYFRLYDKLAGMTGTAETEAQEFYDIYKLDVLPIPTNKPCIRKDDNDVIYKTRREKYNAVIAEIQEAHKTGQPVLVGTTSVESSEVLSKLLKRAHVPHNVLNAKYHQKEAEIVSLAGQRSAVTIATNMAGRGTDIKLGQGIDELGGLFVIGTERHESRRIDRQLRGRCARQGDPGKSKFYVSLEDDLMRLFSSGGAISKILDKTFEEGEELEHPLLNRSIESAQKKVEQHNYSIRKRLLQYDDVLNRQREVIYNLRNDTLHTDNPKEIIYEMIEEEIDGRLDELEPTYKKDPTGEQTANLLNWVNSHFPVSLNIEDIQGQSIDGVKEILLDRIQKAYGEKESIENADDIKGLERFVIIRAIDQHWQDHLTEMDELRRSVGLRGYGQKDPLSEYKSEAFVYFEQLMGSIRNGICTNLFRTTTNVDKFQQMLQRVAARATTTGPGTESEQQAQGPERELPKVSVTVRNDAPKVGRNDPCPCGSGKKYKKCCG